MTKVRRSYKFNGRNVGSMDGLVAAIHGKARERAFNLQVNAAVDMARRMKELTPFRTGHARSSYYVATPGFEPQNNPECVGDHPVDISGIKGPGLLKVGNTAEYFYELEYGSSNQAPNGMVRLTALNFSEFVAEAAREIGGG